MDEHAQANFYEDADGDGYGASGPRQAACSAPPGYAESNDDCDDIHAEVNPGATEDCDNGLDDDCNGISEMDVVWIDSDRDGYGAEGTAHPDCPFDATDVVEGGDCDDAAPRAHPDSSEDCTDGFDNDCDGYIDVTEWWRHSGGDGLGDPDYGR